MTRIPAAAIAARSLISFEGDIGDVIDCNCSLCQKRGVLAAFHSESAFTLKTPRER